MTPFCARFLREPSGNRRKQSFATGASGASLIQPRCFKPVGRLENRWPRPAACRNGGWRRAEIIKQIGFEVAEAVKKANVKDNGNEDAEAVIARFQLAYMAIRHVAVFARDKCRIIVTPDGPLN